MTTAETRPLWPIALTFACSILGAIGQGFFKVASEKVSIKDPMTWLGNWKLIVGLGFYGLATALFIIALKHGKELSTLYPVIAMSYVWVLIISRYYFHEKVGVMNWVGIAVIVMGVVLTTWHSA